MSRALQLKLGKVPLGHLLIATSSDALVVAEFGDTPARLLQLAEEIDPNADLSCASGPFLQQVWSAYEHYLEDPEALSSIPVSLGGTLFQQRVWQALTQIPTGEQKSYRELAEAIGQPSAVRAVASACARNSIALRIPCHRILRSDGKLGGYRWGLTLKQRLLSAEAKLALSQ